MVPLLVGVRLHITIIVALSILVVVVSLALMVNLNSELNQTLIRHELLQQRSDADEMDNAEDAQTLDVTKPLRQHSTSRVITSKQHHQESENSGEKKEREERGERGRWSTDEESNEVRLQQRERRLLLRQFCKQQGPNRRRRRDLPFYDWTRVTTFSHQYRFAYCKLGKVASSTWLRMLNTAVGDPNPNVRRSNKFKAMRRLGPKFRHFYKYLFVRHPFDRLVSAYHDKFAGKRTEYWSELAPTIIRRHRVNASSRSLRRGNDVSFAELVRYLVDPRSPPSDDFHWTPQTVLCQPCRVDYDFVGHYETLQADSRHVLRRLGMSDRVNLTRLNVHRGRAGSMEDRVRAQFANLSSTLVEQLREFYRLDFEAFGYNSTFI